MALALNCGIPSTPQGRELVQHGSALFPIACYEERLTCYSVPWHWHEDFEYILAYEGTVTVGVDKKRICLAEGEGVFINSGVLHAVEFAAEGPSALRSGVFHPRLVGGMDTIYWQKLIRPLLQPGVPSYFLLSKGEPWQAEVLARLWEAWHAVDEEPDDYENRVRYLLSAALHTLAAHCPVGECRSSRQEQVAAQRMKQMLRFVENKTMANGGTMRNRGVEVLVTVVPVQNKDFERWVKEGSCVYMASYTAFQPYDYVWISRLFVPVEEVMEEVENRCRKRLVVHQWELPG